MEKTKDDYTDSLNLILYIVIVGIMVIALMAFVTSRCMDNQNRVAVGTTSTNNKNGSVNKNSSDNKNSSSGSHSSYIFVVSFFFFFFKSSLFVFCFFFCLWKYGIWGDAVFVMKSPCHRTVLSLSPGNKGFLGHCVYCVINVMRKRLCVCVYIVCACWIFNFNNFPKSCSPPLSKWRWAHGVARGGEGEHPTKKKPHFKKRISPRASLKNEI